jgi:iron complex outermembrane recepter protein
MPQGHGEKFPYNPRRIYPWSICGDLEMSMKLKVSAVAVAFALAHGALAEETATMPEILVTADKMQPLPALTNSGLDENGLARKRTNTSDTAKLLDGQPGVSVYSAGGVSSIPAIHGMADDRVRIKVDGMDLISACANHMNAPLSYIDPSSVGNVKVFAGITPVSMGGDSIAGTIEVNSQAPEFAQPGQSTLVKGQTGVFYRSNGNAKGGNLLTTIASENLNMTYSGSVASSGNYRAANDFKAAGLAATGRGWLDGNEVGSSYYLSRNQALGVAMRQDNHLVELRLGKQDIPYQGFPNQRMDMTGNDSNQINVRYTGQYQWGVLEARAYNEHTRHSMNFGEDKMMNPNPTGMPMDTDGKNTGALVKAGVALGEQDVLNLGAEYQRYRLSDWWSRSGTGGMAPNTFWNINDGQRDRFDLFAEWESRLNQQWASQLGVRSETVKMNTGTVQGYCNSTSAPYPCVDTRYQNIANAFNTLDRQHTDNNLDLTALARYTPDTSQTFEAGYAMKTRSPNLYERYTWSTQSNMVLNMNNWFGDGNGYVGNVNLKPEVASTASVTGSWHDAAQEVWNTKISPYYTHIDNYIDAVACTTCAARTDGFANLTFANQSARLYGADISGRMLLSRGGDYGSFSTTGVVSYVNGKNLTTGDNLYNIMPLNLKLAVEQRIGNWTNTIETKLVAAKDKVEAVRKEMRTGGYGLLNLYSSYEWKQARFDIGIENVLNKFYNSPLGGAYLGQGSTMGTAIPHGTLVPGMGRSFNTALTVKF